ncbi:MAG: response regulator [Candidatus Woesearchaeota archaeon]
MINNNETQRQLYYELINKLPVCVYIYVTGSDNKKQYEFLNDYWEKLFKIKNKEDLISDPFNFKNIFDYNNFENFVDVFSEKTIEKTPFIWEGKVLIEENIHWINLEFTPTPIDHQYTRWICIAHDLTDVKKAEQILKQSEWRLQGVLENVPTVSVQGYTMDGTVIYWNKASSDFYGYSKEEAIGKNILDLIIPDELQKNVKKDMKKMAETGIPIPSGELDLKRKDGSIISVYSAHSLVEVPGQSPELFCIDTDLNKIKKIEQASKSKSEFLANMSHEIRTPLNAIVGLSHLMRKTGLTEQQHSRLDQIDDSSRHLLSIINDILDLSKIEAGQIKLSKSDFNLSSLVDTVTSLIGALAREKGLEVNVELNDVPRFLHGDSTRLRQSLLNFVGNAVKFTNEGSITVRTSLLEQEENNLFVKFEVIDTGIGISQESQDKLFKPFEQVENSATRNSGGTGLGLAITKRLSNLMGGDAGVESEVGKGSTFWFTTWLSHGKNEIKQKINPPSVQIEKVLRNRKKKSHLLLAEDNAVNREVARELLEIVGISVDTAENGEIAVKMASEKTYDLILMDIQMPVMDGLTATKLIYQNQTDKKTPVLAMTANVFDEGRQDCVDVGMVDFIPKPVDPSQLYSALNAWLPKDEGKPLTDIDNTILDNNKELKTNNDMLNKLSNVYGLDTKLGMKLSRNDISTYLRILRLFVEIHNNDAEKISNLISQGHLDDAEKITHALKGTSGNIGAVIVQSLSNDLDTALKYRDTNQIQELWPELLSTLSKLLKDLNFILKDPNDKYIEASDKLTEDQRKVIFDLIELLEKKNSRSSKFLKTHKQDLISAIGSELFMEIERAINMFDFSNALHIIKKTYDNYDNAS